MEPDGNQVTTESKPQGQPEQVPVPTVGRIVHYNVREGESGIINFNGVRGGDVLPAIVVRVWTPTCVNLRIVCDGVHDAWQTSVCYGTLPGQWSWPPRA